jgi:hypothetical protein
LPEEGVCVSGPCGPADGLSGLVSPLNPAGHAVCLDAWPPPQQIRPMKTETVRMLALAVATACLPWSADAATFDDIQFWAGNGANRAALVIDWNDGKEPASLLWGYRWDGAATGLDMFQAVVAADPRLFAHLGEFPWGTAIFGIGYDLNSSGGFAVNPNLVFDSGGLTLDSGAGDANDARVPADSADHYVEGWNNGFWAYYLKSSGSEDWTSAMTGADGRALADGVWDGYSFAAGFNSSVPSEPLAAVPEPGMVSLLVLGFLTILCTRRYRS